MQARSTKPMWAAKVGYLVSAAALVVLGLFVLLYPQVSMLTEKADMEEAVVNATRNGGIRHFSRKIGDFRVS